MSRAQISADFVFSIFAFALVFLSFIHFAVSAGEEFSGNVLFFKEFSEASIEGDRILLNPEEGLASREFGRVRNHSLKAVPKNGNSSGSFGYCQFRAGEFEGKIVVFRICRSPQNEESSE